MKAFLTASIVSMVFFACRAPLGGQEVSFAPPADRVPSAQAIPVTPLNVPQSQFPTAETTILTGIRKDLITATVFVTGGGTVGAVYDRNTQKWTQLTIPGASSTAAYGPDPSAGDYRIVGSYTPSGETGDVGFIYDASTKKVITITAKVAGRVARIYNYTVVHSIKGNHAVGNYNEIKTPPAALPSSANSFHAFIYELSTRTFTTIDMPNAASTTAYGIWQDGSVIAIAGGYTDSSGNHAYVKSLDGSSKLVYNYPGAVTTHFEGITGTGKAGNYNVVGDFSDVNSPDGPVNGFFLPITNWKAGTPVIIGRVSVNSVYARTAVGLYQNGKSLSGYYVDIPVQDPP